AHYRTRGLVTGVSGEGADSRVAIHHEAIPAFKDRDGKPSPMESMVMSFAIAPGVDRARIEPAAKLDFEFDVIWSSGSPLVITKLQVLPADASLVLSNAH
ncbi:MAG TPA: copper-binding protein, partial [Polyangiales bacterium]|nr:copper-binding protein [Polyangiales bacterium]